MFKHGSFSSETVVTVDTSGGPAAAAGIVAPGASASGMMARWSSPLYIVSLANLKGSLSPLIQ